MHPNNIRVANAEAETPTSADVAEPSSLSVTSADSPPTADENSRKATEASGTAEEEESEAVEETVVEDWPVILATMNPFYAERDHRTSEVRVYCNYCDPERQSKLHFCTPCQGYTCAGCNSVYELANVEEWLNNAL